MSGLTPNLNLGIYGEEQTALVAAYKLVVYKPVERGYIGIGYYREKDLIFRFVEA
jgi:hypothetical protein